MMQTQLPEGLRALMQASQILQQESMPVVQTPVGPKPTVAGSISQGLQQLAEQKAQPFTQTVGLDGLGRQAGLGAQIQAQQMARQQQMAQNPEAIAQLAAQMMQRRPEQEGIANLPANMGFQEGGIIGYNGEDTSLVAPGVSQEFGGEPSVAFEEASPQEIKAMTLTELQRYNRQDPTVLPDVRARMGATKAESSVPFFREVPLEMLPRSTPDRRQPSGVPPTTREEPSVALPAAPVAPTVEGMLAQARAIAPDTTEKSIKELQELRGREERFRAGMENIEQQGIAAIQSAAQERRAAAQRTREDDNLRRFLSAMRSIRTGGDEYVKTLDALDQRDALSRQAEQNEQLAILKFKEAEQNRKLGKFDRERTDILKGNEYAQKARENFLKALQITTQADTSIFSTQSQARNVAMQTASAAQDRALAREQREKIETDRRIDAIDKTINELLQKRQAAKLAPQISMMMGNTPDAIKMREQQPDLWNNYVRDQAAINQQLQVLQNRRNQLVGIDGFGQLTVQ